MSINARWSFSGHETFPFRCTWPKKAVDGIHKDEHAFVAADAMVKFGVGKNMVSSIRHWGLTLDLLEPVPGSGRVRPLKPTALGQSLLSDNGWDPYLEDPGTLWLLHWRIASRPIGATTWWWAFNQHPGTVFTRAELLASLASVAARHGRVRATDASLKRDIEVFVRTYVPLRRSGTVKDDTLDCPLAQLGLIVESSQSQTFQLVRGDHDSLPVEIFAYALADYFKHRTSDTQTATLEDMLFADGAPGRVFCLNEHGLLRRLERLERMTSGGVVFDETAGLKQLYVHHLPEPIALLQKYYQSGRNGGRT